MTRRHGCRRRRPALTAPSDVLTPAGARFAQESGELLDDRVNPAVREAAQGQPPAALPQAPHRSTQDPLWSRAYIFVVIAVVLTAVGIVAGIGIHEAWAAVGQHLHSLLNE